MTGVSNLFRLINAGSRRLPVSIASLFTLLAAIICSHTPTCVCACNAESDCCSSGNSCCVQPQGSSGCCCLGEPESDSNNKSGFSCSSCECCELLCLCVEFDWQTSESHRDRECHPNLALARIAPIYELRPDLAPVALLPEPVSDGLRRHAFLSVWLN